MSWPRSTVTPFGSLETGSRPAQNGPGAGLIAMATRRLPLGATAWAAGTGVALVVVIVHALAAMHSIAARRVVIAFMIAHQYHTRSPKG
jgi:hypothetical protein